VAEPFECLLHVLFERKACVIGADSNTHNVRLYYTLRVELPAASYQLSALSSQRRLLAGSW
jgi:hypothetical protein